jgi:hypothetical protein
VCGGLGRVLIEAAGSAMREMSAFECTSHSAPRRVNVAEVPIAEVVIAYLNIVTNRQARTRTGPVES